MTLEPVDALRLYFKSLEAAAYAKKKRLIGGEFETYGRSLGRRLVERSSRAGVSFLLNPVSIVRYFEFDFAQRLIPPQARLVLDVASPKLLPLYVAEHLPAASVRLINPDEKDIAHSAAIAAALELANVTTGCAAFDTLAALPDAFDCITTLSVLEHVHGAYDDGQALAWAYGALRPGGRLLLTLPVDRTAWDEHRDEDPYGTQSPDPATGRYFFQRFYTPATLQSRLHSRLGVSPTHVRWFGEREPGIYRAYEQRWIREGFECTVDDPREIVDHWREYDSWEPMPGLGVVGLAYDKP